MRMFLVFIILFFLCSTCIADNKVKQNNTTTLFFNNRGQKVGMSLQSGRNTLYFDKTGKQIGRSYK